MADPPRGFLTRPEVDLRLALATAFGIALQLSLTGFTLLISPRRMFWIWQAAALVLVAISLYSAILKSRRGRWRPDS